MSSEGMLELIASLMETGLITEEIRKKLLKEWFFKEKALPKNFHESHEGGNI